MIKTKTIRLIPFQAKEMLETVHEIPKGVSLIKAPEFWSKGNKGKGVTIAIIDSGCDCNHPDLKDRIIGKKNFTTDDNGDENIVTDYVGHGTHVAGTIAASENGSGVIGVAPEANLLILKALDNKGSGSYQWIINAINYAIDEKVHIISMSLGGEADIPELHAAVKRAVENNILVVCAAGNSGDDDPTTDEFDFPGAYNEVISVGAIDYTMDASDFSNSNKEVDLVAPGRNILSTYPNNKYKIISGTSMATPHVAGALALILNWANTEFDRKLTEPELYAQLIKHTITLPFKKSLVGNGIVYLTAPELLEDFIKKENINPLVDNIYNEHKDFILKEEELNAILGQLKVNQQRIKENPLNYYDENKDKTIIKNYYANIDFNNSSNLSKALSQLLIDTHKPISYDPTRYLYKWVDLHSNGKLKSIYSGKGKDPAEAILEDKETSIRINKILNEIHYKSFGSNEDRHFAIMKAHADNKLNCEHTVCQSWFNKAEPMRGDLHHLFACDPICNSLRSNYPYHDFEDYNPESKIEILKNIIKNDCGKASHNLFEPESSKGIVARAVLYFLLRYPNKISSSKVDIALLLRWHNEFPVDLYEKHRNASINEIQGNRNPFIDFPELANKINFNLS